MTVKERWQAADIKARVLTAVVALIVAVGSAVAGLVTWIEARGAKARDEQLSERLTGCLIIPDNGLHEIPNVRAGEMATITWRNIDRLRDDCGKPLVSAKLTNGGRIVHDPELTIGEGVVLNKGVQDMRYGFEVPPNAKPGIGIFQIWVSFPNAVGGAPPIMSPPVPFVIEAP